MVRGGVDARLYLCDALPAGRPGYLAVARIAVAALAMVLADMQVQERPATEAETAKRTGRIRGPGHVVLLTIQVKPTVVKPGCGCCGGLMESPARRLRPAGAQDPVASRSGIVNQPSHRTYTPHSL
jgi:hypothetical protein